jgi:predicted nucleic acid-binding protein
MKTVFTGLTFDTGMLIALSGAEKRARTVVKSALETGLQMTVPAVVVAEWWRADRKKNRNILASLIVEPITDRIARLAGEATAAKGASTIDAIVMASAAQRGDVVYTSDVDDMLVLYEYFSSVQAVLSASG